MRFMVEWSIRPENYTGAMGAEAGVAATRARNNR